MKIKWSFLPVIAFLLALPACQPNEPQSSNLDAPETEAFSWNPENFSDKRILRYQIPGFDQLMLRLIFRAKPACLPILVANSV